jgi:hypothetical protein
MIDEELIIEIWETFRDYIPEKTRETAANQFLEFLQAHDVDEDTLEGLKGYDPHLDDAIELSLGSEEEEDEDEDDDDWGDEDEDDEDY